MLESSVGVKRLQIGLKLSGVHFTSMIRKSQHLVASVFHSPALMHSDMACPDSDNSLIIPEHRSDDSRIGLSASHKEKHIRVRDTEGLLDLLFRAFGIWVKTISWGLLQIGLGEAADDTLMSSLGVIALK